MDSITLVDIRARTDYDLGHRRLKKGQTFMRIQVESLADAAFLKARLGWSAFEHVIVPMVDPASDALAEVEAPAPEAPAAPPVEPEAIPVTESQPE